MARVVRPQLGFQLIRLCVFYLSFALIKRFARERTKSSEGMGHLIFACRLRSARGHGELLVENYPDFGTTQPENQRFCSLSFVLIKKSLKNISKD